MTVPAQIALLRQDLAAELEKDTPDVHAVNVLRRDLGRLERRQEKKPTCECDYPLIRGVAPSYCGLCGGDIND